MPRTIHSNGVKSEIKALAVMQLNKPVTPQEINAHVQTGDYAAKYVSMLTNTWGFKFTTQRDGRRVVSYTLVSEPSNGAELRAMTPVVKTPKAAKQPKVAKVQKVAKVAAAPVVAAAPAVVESAAKKLMKQSKKPSDPVVEEFGTSGSVGTIDGDWDSVDGLDLRKIV